MSDQADRIEALLTEDIEQLRLTNARLTQLGDQIEALLASGKYGNPEPLDATVWPDWFRDLYSLPGFTKTLEETSQWLAEKKIGEAKANETASYIRSVWPGKGRRPWKQPWATFRTNVVRQPQWSQDGKSSQHLRPNPEEQAAEDTARAQRLTARRAEVPAMSGDDLDKPESPSG